MTIRLSNGLMVEENARIRVNDDAGLTRFGYGLNPWYLSGGSVVDAYIGQPGGHAYVDHPEEPWCLRNCDYKLLEAGNGI